MSSFHTRVKFDPKPTVQYMHAWDFAYKEARKGEWIQKSADRERFNQRIQRFQNEVSNVLDGQNVKKEK